MKCARRPSWPSGPIWKVRPVWDSTSTCPSSRWARSVRSRDSPPRPCVNTTGRGSWCRGARKAVRDGTVCGRRPARAGATPQSGRGINLNGVMRILELEEENRQLRHEVQELTGVTGIQRVHRRHERQRSPRRRVRHRARYWRGQLHAEVHALPAGESSSAQSKSMVLWHTAKH